MSSDHAISTLPTLQALRILEACVRHQSYSSAARELGLTHGAVSRQIDSLTAWVGTPLFSRANRRMAPTDAARSLVTRTREALRILEDAFGHPVLARSASSLRISTTPSIARQWLVPRLSKLIEAEGNLISAIEVSTGLDAGWSDDLDCAIRFGRGNWPRVETQYLGNERLFPVASPKLLERYEDWRCAPLVDTPFQTWRRWRREVGWETDEPMAVALHMPDHALAIDVVLEGSRVALGRERLVAPLLETGHLVRLSEAEIEDIYGYWFVYPQARSSESVLRLRDWLVQAFMVTPGDQF